MDPANDAALTLLARIIHRELNRVRRDLEALHLGHFEIDVGIDLIVIEDVPLL